MWLAYFELKAERELDEKLEPSKLEYAIAKVAYEVAQANTTYKPTSKKTFTVEDFLVKWTRKKAGEPEKPKMTLAERMQRSKQYFGSLFGIKRR